MRKATPKKNATRAKAKPAARAVARASGNAAFKRVGVAGKVAGRPAPKPKSKTMTLTRPLRQPLPGIKRAASSNPAQDAFGAVSNGVNSLVSGLRGAVNLGEGTVNRAMKRR